MVDENLDEDLQNLLNQLDEDEFSDDNLVQEINDVVSEDPESEDPEDPESEDPEDPESEEPEDSEKKKTVSQNGKSQKTATHDMAPTDVRRLDKPSQALVPADSPEAVVDAKAYLDQLDGVTKDVLQACQSDRQEAQDVINVLRRQIDNAINQNQAPQRMYVDGLVKAVEVKAGINATAVKMMEGVSKMLAATKAGVNIQNNNLQVSGSELDELLSQDVPDDFD